MIRPGGRIALILPTSSMMGGSYDAKKNQPYSWQGLRNLLYDHYDEIVVVSIAQPKKKDSAFSADSDYADCMVIARRIPAGRSPSRRAHFVNLKAGPATKLEAQETARAIKRAIADTGELGTWSRVKIGDEEIGFVYYENVVQNRKWTTVRIAEPTLVERAKKLAQGKLHLPQRAGEAKIPIAAAGSIAQVGPVDRDITGRKNSPFSKRSGYKSTDEYPMLWNHDTKRQATQNRMLVEPDSHGEVMRNQNKAAQQMWDNTATHLHINRHFQFNANATAAAFTQRPSLGGAEWPTLTAGSPQQEKALCVWVNSTLGMLSYWIASNRRQDGRGQITITFISNLPVLDVTKLGAAQLAAAVKIFDDLQEQTLLPANEAWRDPIRQELDRRLLTEVLELDDQSAEQLDILRRQWCSEPTVTSTKKTGPLSVAMNQHPEASRLRDESMAEAVDVEPADRKRFQELADRWQEETVFLSNSGRKNAHPAHQEIVSMGEPVVPLILERMRSRGGHWFEALQQITGARPVPPESRGQIKEMTQAWLDWGERNGYV